MKVKVSRSLLEQIMSFAAADHREVCGLLLGEPGRIREIRPAPNVAADPARHFELAPAILLAAHKTARAGGPAVLGHYHSHPSGPPAPSAIDAASAAPDGSLWLIIGRGGARLWIAAPGEGSRVRFIRGLLDIM